MAGDRPERGTSVSTVLGRRLGGELLRMREARGMRQAQAAEALTASVPKVAKMERGLVPMRDPDIRALCHLYEMDDAETVGRLLGLAKLDRERRRAKGWWRHAPNAGALAEYIALEDVASLVRNWQLSLIPGLCQTAEYARALLGAWHGPDAIERSVEIRMRRQARLTGERPLQVHAVVWEAALRQLVGGSEVMRNQLGKLLDLTALPNVTLQVLPYAAGAHPCLTSPFNIVSFAEPGAVDVVHLDGTTSTVWVEHEDDSALYRESFDRTAGLSLTPDDSAAFIDDLRKET
ncbi:DNA-binding protein [Streptomyces sp. NRRL F-5755]|uniref:helix-turn-helix domain-containing protein n=1 Tax=Streptomyces sp. NRRL F-5755 TaxID=1519475 RepID=UPI0006B04D13|nr:helix-turn-helix transcriptional regulator [Streptomyces sp. NRRL F-5755]KOT91495.1 DNA-binding protein [Streptomyces sp. NRRL F-5755]